MKRKISILILAIVILAGAGGGYYYYRQTAETAQAATEPAIQTATVRRGSLVISASGSGSVIAAQEADLTFERSGRLVNLYVKEGDQVEEGGVLAILESSESSASLSYQLSSAKLAVLKAERSLKDLLATDSSSLAQAKLDLLDAKDTLESLEAKRSKMNYQRCSQDTIDDYQASYDLAVAAYQRVSDDARYDAMQTALANLNWCVAYYTEAEIVAQDLKVTLAELEVTELEQQIEQLQAGADATEVAMAEAELENAQAQLALVEEELEQEELISPFSGTVMAVNAAIGDLVSTSPIITLADLNHPTLEIFVDETDITQIGVGYEVEVVFDAFPDETFTGRVISVDPSLTSSGNVQAVRGLMQLDEGSFSKPQTLILGLNASVEIIGSRAENALLVPVEALREITPGSYSVFVMEGDQPTLKIVEVGLMDYTYAEIKSGLNEGDIVTTGVVETGQ
jgi:HlyD family secretion protein